MSKRTPKIPKLNTTLLLFYVGTWNFLKAIIGNGYCFVAKGGTFPTETIRLFVRSSGLWEAYTQSCPKWDKFFTTRCRVPFHDSMPSFMNFRRVLDLLAFKSQVSQCFAGNQQCPGVRNSFPFLAWDLSIHPRTKHLIFQPVYMHRSVCMQFKFELCT